MHNAIGNPVALFFLACDDNLIKKRKKKFLKKFFFRSERIHARRPSDADVRSDLKFFFFFFFLVLCCTIVRPL